MSEQSSSSKAEPTEKEGRPHTHATTTKTTPGTATRAPTKRLNNERIREILLQDEERLQKNLQPLFYAMLRGAPVEQQKEKQRLQHQEVSPASQSTIKKSTAALHQSSVVKSLEGASSSAAEEETTTTQGPPPIVPIDDYIPQDRQAIRETPIFSQLYRLIQFQRDQYLVGTEYATWQQKERQGNAAKNDTAAAANRIVVQADPTDQIPLDPTALGHLQLAPLAANFIPSQTVHQATLPLVTPLATTTLYPFLQRATADVIQGQQANLNDIVRNSVLTFLQNPHNRLAIKKSTHGFIETKYNETTTSSSSSNGEAF